MHKLVHKQLRYLVNKDSFLPKTAQLFIIKINMQTLKLTTMQFFVILSPYVVHCKLKAMVQI